MSWWKAAAFGSYALGWLERASRDGVITTDELLELGTEALRIFEIDVRIELPPVDPLTGRSSPP